MSNEKGETTAYVTRDGESIPVDVHFEASYDCGGPGEGRGYTVDIRKVTRQDSDRAGEEVELNGEEEREIKDVIAEQLADGLFERRA
jgi:hypothetical protein